VIDAASTRGSGVSEKAKHPKPQANVFNLDWETENDPEDADEQRPDEASDERDFEGHASGFNQPSSS
jgi:hypothetical protein